MKSESRSEVQYGAWHRLFWRTLVSTFLASALVLLVGLSPASADDHLPTVNGLFYGDGDELRYIEIGESSRGSKLYAYIDGSTYYSALVVGRDVNDNVHGNRNYTRSADWTPPHLFKRLSDSEFMGYTLSCGSTSWVWKQGYADQPDDPKNNTNPTWFSDETAGAGEGTPPPAYESSSSLVWNMNNYASGDTPSWDVTDGGTLSYIDWKSPFDDDDPDDVTLVDGYPASGDITFSETHGWEWAMVYEWSADLAECGTEPIRLEDTSSHHSPAKTGGEDDPIDETDPLYDWGDLPATYPTFGEDNGARHEIVAAGAYLGAASADAEDDGEAGASADGDDEGAAYDEDGVVFLTPLVPGSTAEIQVTAGISGNLSAWIDFDGDGGLDRVSIAEAEGPATVAPGPLSDRRLDASGIYTFTIDVPGTATGVMYSRWRFTNEAGQGGAAVTGAATTGEVEDHALAAVGNYIWHDSDGDGIQDEPASSGMNGVVVRLLDADGDPVLDGDGDSVTATTSNDADGNPGYYRFSGLLPDFTYRIGVDAPEGYVLTVEDADGSGMDGGDNSDVSQATGLTEELALGAGDDIGTVDAGLAVRDLELTIECLDHDGSSPFVIAIDKVAHTGDSVLDASGVQIEHTFGDGVTYDSFSVLDAPAGSTTTASVDGQTVTLSLSGTLAPSEVWRVELLVDVDGEMHGTVSNSAAVSLQEAESFTYDNEDACGSTLPVSLAFFRALPTSSGVRIAWTTATEVGNLGFHLFASRSSGIEQLTDAMVPSKAVDSHLPLDYAIELDVVPAEAYYIEDIDVFGRAERHGPFELGRAYGERPEVEPIDWGSIRAEAQSRAEVRARNELAAGAVRVESLLAELGEGAAPSGNELGIGAFAGGVAGRLMIPGTGVGAAGGVPSGLASGDIGEPIAGHSPRGPWLVAEIRVDRSGIVRVTYEQLTAAGVDLMGLSPEHLAVINRGEPIPIFVSGQFRKGAYIEFYAEALDTIYTATNVYRLIVGSDLPAPREPRRIAADKGVPEPAWYWETRSVNRQRRYYFGARGDDPWMDTLLIARPEQPAEATLEVEIDRLAVGMEAAALRVEIMGGTDWPVAPDHRVVVELNGVEVAEEVFDGLEAVSVEVRLPPGLLVDGTNRLRLVAPGDTGVTAEAVWIDRVSVTYPREIVARDGRLMFDARGNRIAVAGLSHPDVAVYRIEDDRGVRLNKVAVERASGAYTASFRGTKEPARYVVAGADALVPVEVGAVLPESDITSEPADYLMIANPDFVVELEPLAALRRSEGLSVRVVDVRRVYEHFGDGILDPRAIRDFIRYAHANLGTRYVLLGGGDAYDYRGYTDAGSLSFVPSLYAATGHIVRHAPVDPLFADVDEDEVPDLAIGRLPARTPSEMASLVRKTIAYGSAPTVEAYRRTAVFAADKDDESGAFTRYSEAFASGLPAGWDPERAHMKVQGKEASRQTLIEALNRGVALTSFIGHSGPTLWSFDRLFTSDDASTLGNRGRPTVVTQWGCWNTYYVSPTADTMAHRLLLSGDQGAAAVLGGATLTSTGSEVRLGSLLMPRLVEEGMRIGDAVLQAKQQLGREHPGLIDVQLGWALLGDPTIVVEPAGN